MADGASWTSELITIEGDDYFAAVLAEIAAATTSVIVETYILGDDPIGHALTAALGAAAARGVEVRLLVDGVGSWQWIRARHRIGVRWRVYHPPPWLVMGAHLPHTLHFINRRNHRKICIIDGRVAWVGSFNWECTHSRKHCADRVWRDTVARVEGQPVAVLVRAFASAWAQSWRPTRRQRVFVPTIPWRRAIGPVTTTGPVRLNATRGLRRRQWRDLLEQAAAARQRVWITTPYFVPSDDLLRTLAEAAKHSDVRLLLPYRNDVKFMTWVAAVYVERLLASGVRLWIHPRMVHAKTWVIDERGLVGSSNLNSRSLRFDLEADVWLDQPTSVATLSAAFLEDCSHSVELPRTTRPPWWMRLLGNTFLLLRRYL